MGSYKGDHIARRQQTSGHKNNFEEPHQKYCHAAVSNIVFFFFFFLGGGGGGGALTSFLLANRRFQLLQGSKRFVSFHFMGM